MKTNLNRFINTPEQAKSLLLDLFQNNESYHPEDSAHDIIDYSTGSEIFYFEEAEKLDLLMQSVLSMSDFDPCEFLLELEQH